MGHTAVVWCGGIVQIFTLLDFVCSVEEHPIGGYLRASLVRWRRASVELASGWDCGGPLGSVG